MSDHCITQFNEELPVGETVAMVYRHHMGEPTNHGADLYQFLLDVEVNAKDNRFWDPSYLAAKFVVWLADRHTPSENHPLDFVSVGVVSNIPTDIGWVYTVVCDNKPTLWVRAGMNGKDQLLSEVLAA